jgi:hypothetical protein
MPRININEKDRTSPGTPGGYSNNTVLIAGFSKKTNEEIIAAVEANPEIGYILPDDNGIFEFESAEDFEKTIGLVAPDVYDTEDTELEARLPAHYGNQMAYELLGMGYPIIYLCLGVPNKTEILDVDSEELRPATAAELMKLLGKESTWEIFKDKASYDFRFVSHGLLTSAEVAKSDDLVKLEKLVAKMREFLPAFNAKTDILESDPATEGEEVIGELAAKQRIFEAAVEKEKRYLASKTMKAEREAIGYSENFIEKSASYVSADLNIDNKINGEGGIKAALEAAEAKNFELSDFNEANAAIAKLAHYRAIIATDGTEDEMDTASGRGDCIALIEVDENSYIINDGTRPEARIVKAVNKMATDANIDNYTGKYCACTVPSVVYDMSADKFGGNRKLPGAFHYLACFKSSLGLGFAEWYAAAGYTRGVSSYSIDHTSVKLGEVAVQALEPRNIKDQDTQPTFAVNVIANFRGSHYLWGNRTCHPLGEAAGGNDLVASHFLNIRQLCTTIKKQLYVSCRRFTFDPNSDVLWINFKNSITPMLDRMKADQGVRDYKIEKVYTDKKATLKARIRIVPIEAVEDFLLEVSLEDSLGETAVTVTE